MTLLLNNTQIDLVRSYGLLASFSVAECHGLLQEGELRRYEQDQMIFPRGGFADEMAWVMAGRALAILPGHGRELEVLHCGPGTCIGFISFIGCGAHFIEYRAMMQTDLLLFDRSLYDDALKNRDALFSRLLMALSYGAFERAHTVQNTCLPHAQP